MATSGYDIFFESPGTVSERVCRVCGSKCEVSRDVLGPTSWAGAMARKKTPHDLFVCPHSDDSWHNQALELVQAIEKSPSPRLKDLMRLDLEDILRANLG